MSVHACCVSRIWVACVVFVCVGCCLSAAMLVCVQALAPPSNDHISVVVHRLHVGVGWKSLKRNFLAYKVDYFETSLELFSE